MLSLAVCLSFKCCLTQNLRVDVYPQALQENSEFPWLARIMDSRLTVVEVVFPSISPSMKEKSLVTSWAKESWCGGCIIQFMGCFYSMSNINTVKEIWPDGVYIDFVWYAASIHIDFCRTGCMPRIEFYLCHCHLETSRHLGMSGSVSNWSYLEYIICKVVV